MHVILELLSLLVDFLFAPLDLRDLRAKRRQQMEDLDRREPRKWERSV